MDGFALKKDKEKKVHPVIPKVINPADDGNGSGSTVPAVRTWTPPVSVPRTVTAPDSDKLKIASKIIDASGVKLKELNLIPDGLFIQLVKIDVIQYVMAYPVASGPEILDYLNQSILHHLRGRRAGLLNKVIPLAQKEYEVMGQNQGEMPGMNT